MAEIIIEKRVSLDYLGDKHKDSYILFKAMPVRVYTEFASKAETIKDNSKGTDLMVDVLAQHFVEGKFAGEAMSKEDVEKFDPENIMKFFQVLTGQTTTPEGGATIDPKDENSSTKQSKTEPEAPPS